MSGLGALCRTFSWVVKNIWITCDPSMLKNILKRPRFGDCPYIKRTNPTFSERVQPQPKFTISFKKYFLKRESLRL